MKVQVLCPHLWINSHLADARHCAKDHCRLVYHTLPKGRRCKAGHLQRSPPFETLRVAVEAQLAVETRRGMQGCISSRSVESYFVVRNDYIAWRAACCENRGTHFALGVQQALSHRHVASLESVFLLIELTGAQRGRNIPWRRIG